MLGAHFFLAFNHEFDVAVQGIALHHGFEGLHVHEKLPFIVARTAGKNGAFRMDVGLFDDGLKGGCIPQFQRVCRLHVVVSINQNSGRIGRNDFLTVHHRIPRCGNNFNVFTACGFELLGHQFRAFLNVPGVRWVGRDGWDTKQFEQLFKEAISVGVDKWFAGRHGQVICFNAVTNLSQPQLCPTATCLNHLAH